ncbi:putative hydrolase of the HAD superfamily [Robiginitalea myxolifaciens]|uniref:Putative hydrolase of the HAD superfamily n=1 Tax=Robiginitalea myxolifaciens TaxID=400055 RepID=A0A1I6GRW9_9FLAO|nr:HAD family phosphatase [Robiginitalea myxolifaciens]SFR44942.1 putative hydrolase of the HAD superfamily [Robiginitalea myxolifaciens]
MIRNVIFDFGDVFINLDKAAIPATFRRLGLDPDLPQFISLNKAYEIGALSDDQFLGQASSLLVLDNFELITRIWNSILADFPAYRLEYLEDLASKARYRLFLLSNTNALHIEHVQKQMGDVDYQRFVSCFEGFHLSHELGMRKPDSEIFEHLLNVHSLEPRETLFIDDTQENTAGAASLGINTWHLKVGTEDVTSLDKFLKG